MNTLLRCLALSVLGLSTCLSHTRAADEATPPDFNTHVAPILAKYCTGCHNADDPQGKLVLEGYEQLMQGGGRGRAIVPGKSDQSRMLLVLDGRAKPAMPPEGNEGPNAEEIAVLKAWIDAGAKSPTGAAPDPTRLVTPSVPLKVKQPRQPIQAAAWSPDGKWIALAGYTSVRLLAADTLAVVRELNGHRGGVNEVVFSPDSSQLVAAAGEPGLFGEVRIWNVADGHLVKTLVSHRDCLYAAALSPDGKLLATGSYDEQIRLWDPANGKELKLLSGHNGAIYGLAFSPNGRWLSSASGDRTIKIWDTATGERLDTRGESLKELYAVAFSPDGQRLVAGGVDNRIRVWQVGKSAREGENPILLSRFAHEGAIVRLAYSPDGRWLASAAENRTVKIWDAETVIERRLLEPQSDVPAAICFSPDSRWLVVGRLDGGFTVYDAQTGKPRPEQVSSRRAGGVSPPVWSRSPLVLGLAQKAGFGPVLLSYLADETKDDKKSEATEKKPPPKPELTVASPRGLQRGTISQLTLSGKNLTDIAELKFSDPKLSGKLLAEPANTATAATLEILPAADLPAGDYELAVVTPGGTSNNIKLYVDSLPQRLESEPNNLPAEQTPSELPAGLWGVLSAQGDVDHFDFDAQAGQTIVFDLSANSIGSKLNAMLTLLDAAGHVIASNNNFDGQADPLLAYTFSAAGRYTIRVSDLALAGSGEHFYRLSAGEFPYVTACYPLGIPANQTSEVKLVGFNLPADAKVSLMAGAGGEMTVPVTLANARSRRELKVVVGAAGESREAEPNDTPATATPVATASTVNGRISREQAAEQTATASDVDLYRFECQQGETWVIETEASRRGSPIDTRIEVLDAEGRPVERLLLQAVRDSYVTFRGIDSQTVDVRVKNWEEMDLNELMYLQGEVCKIFRMPQGPDSGFNFYARAGKRRNYFDTSPTTHAMDEPCYIVEPHAPGTELVPNGLPVFPLYYANDDEGDRKLGRDSRLMFTAPATGTYLVRVGDVRDQGGDRHAYRLTIRSPKPDFSVSLGGGNPTLNAGSGKGFTLTADREDGFDGDIQIDVAGLPPGFSVSNPLVIQAGHLEAKGVLHAATGAVQPTEEQLKKIEVSARALVEGATVVKKVNGFGKITLGKAPNITVHLEPAELVIVPGTTVTATLRVERNGFKDRVQFSVDNLPFGVIVDNIGLNGVLIPEGQSQRQIFLTSRPWVPETSRPFHAVANNAGAQASAPVMLKVQKTNTIAQKDN